MDVFPVKHLYSVVYLREVRQGAGVIGKVHKAGAAIGVSVLVHNEFFHPATNPSDPVDYLKFFICAELSRLGRNLFMIMELFIICMKKSVAFGPKRQL